MTKGQSLHIGLNRVNQAHYAGWSGELQACEADAISMMEIAADCGYETQILLTSAATRAGVSEAITRAAEKLVAGDIFLLSYAGHGGQIPDANGDETDRADETWCLFDGEMIDDELFQFWKIFSAGVRVLVFSDSCHSGTVVRLARNELDLGAITKALQAFGIEKPHYRHMPPEYVRKTYLANKEFYDRLSRSVPPERGEPVATVRLISACKDDQTAAEGTFHGLFTGTLLDVWNEGAFQGDYASFFSEIKSRMPAVQNPNHLVIGSSNSPFDRQRPFTIAE
jgi:metacaspase-1